MELCKSAIESNITYVVELTGLLNEGNCGDGDGRYDGTGSQWRFKHEQFFVVKDCKSHQEAGAFVVALGLENSLTLKQWPCKVMGWTQWYLDLVQEEKDLLKDGYKVEGWTEKKVDKARHVSPKDVNASKAEMAAKGAKYGI